MKIGIIAAEQEEFESILNTMKEEDRKAIYELTFVKGKIKEKTSFNVVLKEAGDQKIKVIKVVRDATGLGLKEAKELVDGAPKTVKENVSKDEAEELKAKFTEVGAVIELQ